MAEAIGIVALLAAVAALFFAWSGSRQVGELKVELAQVNVTRLRSDLEEASRQLAILENELQVHAKVHTEIWNTIARDEKKISAIQKR